MKSILRARMAREQKLALSSSQSAPQSQGKGPGLVTGTQSAVTKSLDVTVQTCVSGGQPSEDLGGAGAAVTGSPADRSLSVTQPRAAARRPAIGAQAAGGARHQILVNSLIGAPRVLDTSSSVWEGGVRAMEVNMASSVAKSTGGNYAYWWGRFSDFCKETGRPVLPFSSSTVCVFLSHLAETSPGLGGVDNARAALGYYHSIRFPTIDSPTDCKDVGLVIRGIKRRKQWTVTKKSPLQKQDFFKILLTATNGGKFAQVRLCRLRLAAQVALMYPTFSRYEESAELRCVQVKQDGADLVVIFKKGKTYQFGEARMAVIAGQPQAIIDPVTVILSYMKRLRGVSGSKDTYLFPAFRNKGKCDAVLDKPASYKSVLAQFKEVVVEAGVVTSPATYGLHSMRRGGVTTAINNGAPEHVVQKQMRVASGATVRRYATVGKDLLRSASAAVFE